MRDYKFRGKRLDNGEWVYGFYRKYLFVGKEISEISLIDGECYSVDPATVGQYTGKQDYDKTEVYEHHIVMDFMDGNHYLVVWDDENTAYYLAPKKGDWMDFETFEAHASVGYRVVGNKVDNPELLEG